MYEWTLDAAVQFIRELEPALAPHYHVALAGSTLHKGFSANDLDVVIIPTSSDRNRYAEVHDALVAFGMRRKVKCSLVHKKWTRKGSTDRKHVEVWDHQGYKIDVFQPYPSTEAPIERAEASNYPARTKGYGGWTLKEDSNLPKNVHAVEEPRKDGEDPVLRVSPDMIALLRSADTL